MSDSAARAQRASALEEKRKKLEDLKKKRALRINDTTDITSTAANAASASASANLDDYIDGLLSSPTPVTTVAASTGTLDTATAAAEKEVISNGQQNDNDPPFVSASASYNDNVIAQPSSQPSARSSVETFTIGTQTDDVEDLPEEEEQLQQQQSKEDTEQQQAAASAAAAVSQESHSKKQQHANDEHDNNEKIPKLLSFKQVEKEVTSNNTSFSSFINTASKKVERILGSHHLISDLLVNHIGENNNTDNNNDTTTSSNNNNKTMNTRFVTLQTIYECPKWTLHRDVTDIDWSPIHRELFLSTYHMSFYSTTSTSSSSSMNTATATMTAISPKDHVSLSSASLIPRNNNNNNNNNELQSDGLCLIWNLSMSNRPEHVFTSGSPITCGKFHPHDANLVIGGCSSGQLIIWDVRSGRLPVQKSSSSLISTSSSSSSSSSSSNSKGHVHPITCMQIIESGSGLVTSSPDGRVNFWSFSNLREPVESIQVGTGSSSASYDAAGISCFGVAPESEALILGDEHGNIHVMASVAALAQSSSTSSGTSSGCGGASSSSGGGNVGTGGRAFARKQVRKLDSSKKAAAAAAAALTTSTLSNDAGGAIGNATGGNNEGNNDNTDSSLEESSLGHYGMITSISTKVLKPGSPLRGAGFSKGFLKGMGGFVLTSGVDWTVKLWSPAISDVPLLNMPSHSYDYMVDVKWNPIHPTLFATASSNGTIGLWNLALSLDEPITGQDGGIIVDQQATTTGGGSGIDGDSSGGGGNSGGSLNKIQWSSDGRRMAVACGDRVHVLLLTDDVIRPKGDEENKTMNHLVARGLLY